MKNRCLLLLGLPLLVLGAPRRAGASAAGAKPAPAVRQDGGPRTASADCPLAQAAPAAPTTLGTADLVFAIEEERVAHDLYVAAAAKWPRPGLARIANAETRHAAALTRLAATAGVVPPAAQPGVFVTADLQRRYGQLLSLVNQSPSGALQAGALIEETDIADLRRLAAIATDGPSRALLARLERASGRHLAADVRRLAALGVTYRPQVLTADDFARLVATGPGARGGCGRGYRGGR